MSDNNAAAELHAPPKRRRGKGAGKPPPDIVFNGSNILGDTPPPKIVDPVEYSEELADRICAWLAAGKSLRSFCLQEGTPSTTTVMRWTYANEAFALRYARARDEGIDRIAEMAHDEAAAAPELPPEKVQGARLAFEARKWYVSKLAPKRYGDKLDVKQEISGPGGSPLTLQVDVLVSMLLTPENMARLGDAHVAAIREAALLLAAPAPPTIDAVAEPVEATDTAGED